MRQTRAGALCINARGYASGNAIAPGSSIGAARSGAIHKDRFTRMKAIIDSLNWLSDQDWNWWPLLTLRPSKHEPITDGIVLKLTTFFGTLSGLAIIVIAKHHTSVGRMLIDITIGWAAFFSIYRTTFVPAWNARARRLADERT